MAVSMAIPSGGAAAADASGRLLTFGHQVAGLVPTALQRVGEAVLQKQVAAAGGVGAAAALVAVVEEDVLVVAVVATAGGGVGA